MLLLTNKILFLFLFMSILYLLRHLYFIIQALITNESRTLMITQTTLLYIGLSISYILVVIFTGIKI